jgi:hypothetical protein
MYDNDNRMKRLKRNVIEGIYNVKGNIHYIAAPSPDHWDKCNILTFTEKRKNHS